MSLAVRTMTALWTSPFFTRPRGAASLTETTMMSPTPAKRRFDPPSTLMHWTRFAPLLSATSRFDCIWIIDPVPSQWLAETRPAVPKTLSCAHPEPVEGSVARRLDVEIGLESNALAGLDAVENLP